LTGNEPPADEEMVRLILTMGRQARTLISQAKRAFEERNVEMARDLVRTGTLQRWAYVSCFSMCYPGQEQATYGRVKELITAAVPAFQLTTGDAATLARNP